MDDEVVFLSGASKGIGRCIATTLARRGVVRMCLVARSKEDLQKTVQGCIEENPKCEGQIILCAADICDLSQIKKAIDLTVQRFGKITSVIHNVGLHSLHSVVTADPEELQRNVNVNLLSVMQTSSLLLPHLVIAQKTQQTRIIFISSALATKWAMHPGWGAYTASKCGVTGYADACFAELRQCGMKVTVVYPGLVETEMGSNFASDFGNLIDKRRRMLQPQDVADAVLVPFSPLVGCLTELTVYPQDDLFRMRMLTEPQKITALATQPVPNFVDKKVALITGAGKGIGRGVALRLAREGYDLALISRTQSDLDSLALEISEIFKKTNKNNKVVTFAIDVTDKENLSKSVEETIKAMGTISTVLSNAGTNRRKSAALANIKVWEDVVQLNLNSAMHLCSLTLPHLLRHAHNSESKSSYLVFMNSGYASSRAPVLPGTAIYTATKSALSGFARSVLEDVRSWGVKVSTIYPSLVNTELGVRPNPQQREGKGVGPGGGYLLVPKEMIQVEDLAELVAYVCSVSSTCVATDLSVDTQRNQQPIIRDQTQKFSEKYWTDTAKL